MKNIALLLLLFAFSVHADESLWRALQKQPNMVVLMRHSYAAGGNPLLWDQTGRCEGERLLTEKGKVFAKQIGEAFREENILPFVVSSPMCRCKETASIAFGKFRTEPALREIVSASSEQVEEMLLKTRSLLLKHKGTRPVVLVMHRPNIDVLTMELVDTGQLVVGEINVLGDIEVLGTMSLHRK